MSRTVLFAGGPLHGQLLVTEGMLPSVYAMDTSSPRILDDPLPEPVAYHTAQFAICGRIVWIGYLGTKPDNDLVFEVLTSDEAKAASSGPAAA